MCVCLCVCVGVRMCYYLLTKTFQKEVFLNSYKILNTEEIN